ncbi:MAG: hypothetical protein P8P30_05675 [Rickettsiales bacterium]|nr:hypothetical protein [Rickettsiales bacterium]
MNKGPFTVKEQIPPERDHSNTFLGLGALSGAYGIFTKISVGYFCPACLSLTPILLTIGLWKKQIKKRRNK